VLLKTLLGLTILIISAAAVLRRMYILKNLTPDELDIKDPPIIHNIIYSSFGSTDLLRVIPELLMLLKILITISLILLLFNKKNKIRDIIITKSIKKRSS
tara:strand:- start:6 stop:305 length:300 start_codon:yes stop_codon:yes gene_type:complete